MNKAKNIDRVWWGVLGGVFGRPCAGYLILGIGWAWAEEESLAYFHREVFVASPLYKDRILSLCTLSVVPLFHWAYQTEKKTISPREPCCSWCCWCWRLSFCK